MKSVRALWLAPSLLALAACGSHNSAPVVYGADGTHTARIYNSPEDIYRKQQRERAQTAQGSSSGAPAARRASASNVETVALTPVSAIYLDDPARSGEVETKKAEGYIEVQPGDTVYAIGRRFGVAPAAVIDANNLRPPYTISVGQALKLPKGARVAVAPPSSRTIVARDTLYTVRKGDTLYSISRASKVPVQKIAAANRLDAPYRIDVGQQLLVPQASVGELTLASAPPPRAAPKPAATASAASGNAAEPPETVSALTRQVSYAQPPQAAGGPQFVWPLRGAIVSEYGAGELGRRNDGVNIAAPAGTSVRAAAAGEVVYRGSELDGFGNLLLIKHANGYVTAYAHNDAMLVRKGEQVRQGQLIAKVGQTGSVTTPQLHFEIRRELKAIDPLTLLGPQ